MKTTNTKQYRILRSDGRLEILRSSLKSALTYARVVLAPAFRDAGIVYTVEVALDGEWRPLRAV